MAPRPVLEDPRPRSEVRVRVRRCWGSLVDAALRSGWCLQRRVHREETSRLQRAEKLPRVDFPLLVAAEMKASKQLLLTAGRGGGVPTTKAKPELSLFEVDRPVVPLGLM